MSDFQYMQTILDDLLVEELTYADGHSIGPAEVHEYLSQVMYARRSKIDPLWNSYVVGGVKDGKRYALAPVIGRPLSACLSRASRFLAYVDLLGTTYTASTIATGYGSMIAIPLLRKAVDGREDVLTEDEARTILEQSLRVLFYRDARSINKVSLFKC
jgi:20S proteasome subunit beta 7